MRKFLFFVLLLVLMLSMTVPVLAQDLDIEPGFGYTRNDLIIIGALVLMLAVVIIFGSVITVLIRRAFDSIPPDVVEWVQKNGVPINIDLTAVERRLDEFFESTPNPVDDHLWDEVKRIAKEVVEDALQQEEEPPAVG